MKNIKSNPRVIFEIATSFISSRFIKRYKVGAKAEKISRVIPFSSLMLILEMINAPSAKIACSPIKVTVNLINLKLLRNSSDASKGESIENNKW